MTPPFFPLDLRANAGADAYVETLQTIVKPPWIDRVANGGRPYVFQQDSAPLQFNKLSKSRIGWLGIFIMSHQTYDLLTYQTLILHIITCGVGVIKKEVNKHPHNTKFSSLMEAIVIEPEEWRTSLKTTRSDRGLQSLLASN
ncbi:hypothetical protein ACTXT7_003870 [Hymenolepis weldensis]